MESHAILEAIHRLARTSQVKPDMDNVNHLIWSQCSLFMAYCNKIWRRQPVLPEMSPALFVAAVLCSEGYTMNHIGGVVADPSIYSHAWYILSTFTTKVAGMDKDEHAAFVAMIKNRSHSSYERLYQTVALPARLHTLNPPARPLSNAMEPISYPGCFDTLGDLVMHMYVTRTRRLARGS